MATKKKKNNADDEGPVKIVGINHGLCLSMTLLSDGWKHETFADVVFHCKPSKDVTEQARLLRANRSVLAAVSPFFASLLPDGELDADICITVEWLHKDVFAVLEYIHSGRLMCSIQRKNRLLKILRQLQIFVPDELQEEPANLEEISVSGNSIGLEMTWNIQLSEDLDGLQGDVHLTMSEQNLMDCIEDSSSSSSSSNYCSLVGSRPVSALEESPMLALASSLDTGSELIQTPIHSVVQSATKPPVIQASKTTNALKMYSRKVKQTSGQSSTGRPKAQQPHQATTVQSSPAIPTSSSAQFYSRRNKPIASQTRAVQPLNVVIQKTAQPCHESIETDLGFQVVKLGSDPDCVLLVAPPDDKLMLQSVPNKEAVTLSSPILSFDAGMYPEEARPTQTQPVSLSRYHADTWCHGIFSPFELKIPIPYVEIGSYEDLAEDKNKEKRLGHWSLLRPPTFLVARPDNVYPARRSALDFSTRVNRNHHSGLNVSVVQEVKTYNGKVHMTLKGDPPAPRPGLPQIFCYKDDQSGSATVTTFDDPSMITLLQQPAIVKERTSCKAVKESSVLKIGLGSTTSLPQEAELDGGDGEDDHQDMIDEALAKHYVQKEIRRKHSLQARLRMFSESLNQHKRVARKLLKAKEDMELKKLEREAAKLRPAAKQRGPYVQCDTCGKMVAKDYLKHHKKIHNGVKSHLCELCGRSFLVKAYLNNHIRINHSDKRTKNFMCSTCGNTFSNKYKLEKHELIHTEEKPFECQFCDRRFREKGTLVRHIRTHTGERPYGCNICGAAFRARFTYVEHVKRMHSKRLPEESVDPKRERDEHSNALIYRCEFCDKGFHRVLSYEKHRATHTGGPIAVRCVQPNCEFTYSKMDQLREHMAAMHPQKTYSCSICSKIFLTKQNLTHHQAKHDPDKGFHCPHCDVVLTTKSSLATHMKIHNRDEPFECTTCGMRFHSAFVARKHMRTHLPGYRKRIRNRKKTQQQEEEEEEEQQEQLESEDAQEIMFVTTEVIPQADDVADVVVQYGYD